MVENSFDFLIGVSCCKSVLPSTFVEEWENNQKSIYEFIEAAHLGMKGLATKNGNPIAGASVTDGRSGFSHTNSRGEYWILKLPGEYDLNISYE